MYKKVIIACYDEQVRRLLKNALCENKYVSDIKECENESEVRFYNKTSDKPILFFDKLFLGYVFKNKIFELKFANKQNAICFCESGNCSRFFGLRVYDFNADAFIAHIEEPLHMKQELSKVMNGHKTFPEEIQDDIDNKLFGLDTKNFSDVTQQQLEIAAYLGEGKSQQEIRYLMNLSTSGVNTQVSYLRNKTGANNDLLFCKLNEVTFLQGK